MKTKSLISALIIFIIVSGCSQNLRKGSVTKKINETKAQIYVGDMDIKKGEKVLLYRCTASVKGNCKKDLLGDAEIVEVNQNSAIIMVAPEILFTKGAFIEKIK